MFAFVLHVHCSEFPHDIPSLEALHMPCIVPVYIRIRILDIPWSLCCGGRFFLDPDEKSFVGFTSFFFCLKAKLDYWYMPLCMCLDVRIYVFGEIIQISGPSAYIRGRGTSTHTAAHPHKSNRKVYCPAPFRFSLFSLLFLFRFLLRCLPSFMLSPSHLLCQAIALATLAR